MKTSFAVMATFFCALTFSQSSPAAQQESCDIYPITIADAVVANAAPGTMFTHVPLGTGEGNFSWLAWRGEASAPVIAQSLIAPGNSHQYINPKNSVDTQLDESDWVEGTPGVKNSRAIRDGLDALIGQEIIIPTWSLQEAVGKQRNYKVRDFVAIELIDYSLNGQGWISFEIKKESACSNTSNPPKIVSQPVEITPELNSYHYSIVMEDADAQARGDYQFSLTSYPAHMAIDSVTGAIQWMPGSEYVQSIPTFNRQCYQLGGAPAGSVSEPSILDPSAVNASLYQRTQSALERGSSYSANAAASWQQENQCQGCHVQLPVISGIERAAEKISVNENIAANLLNDLLGSQKEDGGFYEDGYGGPGNQTVLALWSLSEARKAVEMLDARENALRFLLARQKEDGEGVYWEADHRTGWLDNRFALSAIIAVSASRFILDIQSKDVVEQYSILKAELEQTFPRVADYLLAASNPAATTQQLALEIIALNEIKHSFSLTQSELVIQEHLTALENEIRMRQRSDGGWAYSASDALSDPVTSAWVGRALNYTSPALSDAAVFNNIRYLLESQQADGAWLSEGGQFSQRLAATGLVMSYLPVAMDYLGSPDVRVGHILWQEESGDQARLTANISNIGLADVFVPVAVTFYDGAPENERVLGQTTLFGLPSGVESVAAIQISKTWVKDDVTVVLGVTPLSDECHIGNNQTIAAFVSAVVENINDQSDTQSWLINVDDVNQPPRIDSDPITEINSGQRYYYRVSVTDGDVGDAHSFSLLSAPEPFSIDNKTGVISSPRNSLSAGEYTLTVQVVDLRGALAMQSFTLRVEENGPPIIISDVESAQQEHLPYQYLVMAEDPNAGDEPQFTLQKFPPLSNIDRLSGALTWPVNDQMYVDPLVGENLNCIVDKAFDIDELSPQLKWGWNGSESTNPTFNQVMMAPLVVPVQDTNGDGRHSNADDMAVVFGSFTGRGYLRRGYLRAVSGKTGAEIWTSSQIINDSASIAAADINGDGLTEIIAQLNTAHFGAFDHNGDLIWISEWKGVISSGGASIADIDADGIPEIIAPGAVLDNQGRLLFQTKRNALPFAADVDNDGFQEIVTGGALTSHSGELLFDVLGGFAAVGNFDDDPEAEIVVATRRGGVSLLNHDGSVIWQDRPLGTSGGGAPTIADMNGDGYPEIGIAGSSKYVVINRLGEVVWSSQTRDYSSQATGSSVFDFNGDGKAEVVYADEYFFRIFEGSTGRVLYEEPNRQATLLEFPVIADIDGDGHAEVVVASATLSAQGGGIRAFEGVNGWAPTRKIWNQHAYSISNINDDMSVPPTPDASWLSHNTFRLNTFPDRGAFDLSDISVSRVRYNEVGGVLSVSVANRGNAPVNNVFEVIFTYHDPVNGEQALGQVSVNGLSGQQPRVVELAVPDLVLDGDVSVSINASGIEECNVDNNDTRAAAFEVRAYDEGGLWDSQRFLMSATNTNEAPRIVSRVASSLEQGQLFELQVEVEDPDRGDSFRYALMSAPADFKINPLTGRVSAEGLLQGSVQLDIRVTDNAGSEAVQQHIVSVVEQSNYPPVFESEPVTTVAFRQDYRYVVEAVDPEGGAVSYFLNRAPAGMSINGLTGEIHWHVGPSRVSLYSVEVVAMDELGASSFQYFLVDASGDSGNLIPVITSKPQGFVYAGQAYQYLVQAYDPDGNDLAFYLEDAEPEMSITASGLFKWLPPLESVGQIGYATIVVEDLRGGVAKQRITLPVSEPSNLPPVITSSPQENVLLGNDWLYSATATDEDGDTIRFALLQAPNGMQIQNDTLYWTPAPAQVGISHEVALYAIDARGAAAVQRFSVTVIDAASGNQPPVILSEPSSSPVLGETWLYQVVANDADGDALLYHVLEGPLGVAIDSNGMLSWTPANDFTATQVALSVQVSDGRGGSANQSVLLGIVTPTTINQVPSVTSTPPTPATVNVVWQYAMQVADADGDSLSWALTEAPSGMSIDNNGVVTWTPVTVGSQRVSIRVGDGRAWVYQVFDLPVVDGEANNSAPEITSAANTQAVAEQLYVYAMQATDVEGDSLSYSLLTAPSGMAISNTGVITWQAPVQAGDHSVVVQVSDGHQAVSQAYRLLVRADRNRAPRILSLPESEAVQNEAYRYQVVASDPDGDAISYALLTSPTGMTIDNVGLIRWLPNADQVGNHEVQVAVRDGEYSALQTWLLHVYQEPLPLSVSIHLESSVLSPGDVLPVTLDVVGASADAIITLTNDGENVIVDPFGRAYITAQTAGRHDLFASVSDGEFSTEASAFYTVRDPSDDQAPHVTLHSPVDNSVITAPSEVMASISDATLAAWTLYLSPKAQQNWQVIAEGRDAASAAVIGILDPTLLVNGQYDLVLQAVDANGQYASDSMTLVIDGDLKVGNFTITLEDLNIPVAGIPVRVTRTYDSRRRNERLDFGYGWSVGYQDVKVEESRTPGLYWELNEYKRGPYNAISDFCVEPQGAPEVTVTLPGGEVERFEAYAFPECSTFQVVKHVDLRFRAVGDTQSELEVLGDDSAYFDNGQLVDTASFTNPINPERYKLTTRGGYAYELDQAFGVRRIVDPNGHTLTYSNDGIVHSSGKAIRFNRDSLGRITTITDPKGNVLEYDYNRSGDLVANRDALSNQSTQSYNRGHGLLDIIDPLGRRIVRNIYDDDGRMIAQEDSDGHRTDFNHDIAGRQSVVTDRLGRSTFLYYDDEGKVTQRVDALGNTTSYSYDARGNKLTETNAQGKTSQATYNDSNDQLTQENELGHITRFAYNTRGQETVVTDALGKQYNNAYDALGNLLSVTDPSGNIAGNHINAKGLVTKTVDMLGNETDYTYDADGNKLSETNAEGDVTRWTYDDNGNVLTEVVQRTVNDQPITEATSYTYDALDRVVATSYPDGTTQHSEFDAAGNEVASIDTEGRRTETQYDAYGRVTAVQYADGSHEQKTYDAEGNVIAETDRLNRTTTYTYDALNRQTGTQSPDGSTTQTEYDTVGRVIRVTNARGDATEYEYDDAGRRTAVINALSQRHSYTYDDNGNLLSETDANGHRTEYVYNDLDQKVLTRFHDASTMEDEFDVMGRKTASVDQAGTRTEYGYDTLGRLTEVRQFLNSAAATQTLITSYGYDSQGNKLTQTDADGKTTRWTYDSMGRVTSRTLPMGQRETFTYDVHGNPTSHTDFNGQTTVSEYDSLNRLTDKTYADGTAETWTYDAAGRVTQTRQTINGNTEVTTYAYDAKDRLTREVQPNGSQINYGYDAAGNRTTLTTTVNGVSRTVHYSFDALNRLATVTDLNGTTTYAYDAVGNRGSVTQANEVTTTYSYDSLNRLTELQSQNSSDVVLTRFTYTLGATGRREKIEELSGRVTDYVYDDLYRLTNEQITDAQNGNYSASYQYDPVGNRTYSTIDGVQTAYSYDDNDRLTQQGGTTYSYDANGNTLSESEDGVSTTYTYDARNKMVSSTNAAGTSTYAYDINGIRTQKTEAGVTTNYLVDHNQQYAQVLAESESNITTKQYTYGDDVLSQTLTAANDNNFYLYDGLGSTRALTNSSGSLSDEYNYDAFGNMLRQSGNTDNNYLFTGEQYDAGLDQYYLRARYYDQGVGRFTSMDTYMGVRGQPITLHKYLYANSDPVQYIDPTGNFSLGSLGSGMNIQGVLATTSVRGTARYVQKAMWGEVKDYVKGEITSQAFGLIGGHVVRSMVTAVGNTPYGNSPQGFGSTAHKQLQDIITNETDKLNKWLGKKYGVTIKAELFRDGNGKDTKMRKGGSMGLDVVVLKGKKVILAFDLKTGKTGTSKSKGKKYSQRFDGAPIIDVFVRRTK